MSKPRSLSPSIVGRIALLAVGMAVVGLASCSSPKPPGILPPLNSAQPQPEIARTPMLPGYQVTHTGLQYIDVVVGTGAIAKAPAQVSVHYTGWLFINGEKGKKFDSSVDRGRPFGFSLGAGEVIRGWDEGVEGMKIGGKRTLILPPELGYGARGAGGDIPGNSTLMFDVELLGVERH